MLLLPIASFYTSTGNINVDIKIPNTDSLHHNIVADIQRPTSEYFHPGLLISSLSVQCLSILHTVPSKAIAKHPAEPLFESDLETPFVALNHIIPCTSINSLRIFHCDCIKFVDLSRTVILFPQDLTSKDIKKHTR